jgi:dipeptidyl aminopeptidase/acylaminoacyl peptidase
MTRPAWSPDGTRIAFRDAYGGSIGIIDADGTNLEHFSVQVLNPGNLAWSFDGDVIAFNAFCDEFSLEQEVCPLGIQRVQLEDGALVPLEPVGVLRLYPAWVP